MYVTRLRVHTSKSSSETKIEHRKFSVSFNAYTRLKRLTFLTKRWKFELCNFTPIEFFIATPQEVLLNDMNLVH